MVFLICFVIVSVGTTGDDQSTQPATSDFMAPPPIITPVPMLSDFHLAEWQSPRENHSAGGFKSPTHHQHGSVFTKGHASVPAITVSNHPGQEISQDPISDLDQACQAQAGHSPRDIPLEQSGRSLDPRLDPRESASDPRGSTKERRDSDEQHRDHRGPSLDYSRGYRSRSRSRSRSHDREHARRSDRSRDRSRITDLHSHRDGARSVFDHDVDSFEDPDGRSQRDKRRDRSRGWSHDRERSDKQRDSDRDRGRELEYDVDRPHDVSRSHDVGRVHDLDVTRDVDRLYDVDRSRDFDRPHDVDRSRDSDRPHDLERTCDVDRSHEVDRAHDVDRPRDIDRSYDHRDDHSRIRDREDYERTKEKSHDRDRNRDLDRPRDADRAKLVEKAPVVDPVGDNIKDRGHTRDTTRESIKDPDENNDRSWWDGDRNRDAGHVPTKDRETAQDLTDGNNPSNQEHAQREDAEKPKSVDDGEVHSHDPEQLDKQRTTDEMAVSKDLDQEWRKDKPRDPSQESRETKSRDMTDRSVKSTRSQSASPLYQDIDMSGMSPDVDTGYRESVVESGM